MTDNVEQQVVHASKVIAAPAERIFELIADPTQQPRWDGNDNLVEVSQGKRIRGVGDVFAMVVTSGKIRENYVVEFEEGRRIAWEPASPGEPPAGHLWRWELEPQADDSTLVTHTYDWTQLTDEARFARARSTKSENLMASIDRLAAIAEAE